MTRSAYDKIAAGLNEALAAVQKSPPAPNDALRESAAMFAECLVGDVVARRGARTVAEVAAIREEVVQEIRAQFFAKDITPKDSA